MTKTQNNNEGDAPTATSEVAELVAAFQAAYSSYGWVEEQQSVRLFDEVARLASVIEEGCDCSVNGPMNWQVEIERLRQHSQLQPVSVAERFPGPEDCDEQGRCWVGHQATVDETGDLNHSWELCKVHPQDEVWLPAHTIPLPSAEPPESKGSESPLSKFGPNEMPLG